MKDSKEYLSYIKLLNIKANFLSTEFFAGEYESAFKGRGLEFEEVREYEIGDDIRLIDWKTTAKTGKLYVKKFHEEREISVILMVDISSSMMFGSKWELKSNIANEIAALISYTALKSNDKVGLILFGDKPYKFIPPRKGRSHIWNIIRTIVAYEHTQKIKTDITESLKFVANVIRKKAVVFIISDFIDKDFSNTLKALKKRFDIVPIVVIDKFEEEFLKKINFINFRDCEKNYSLFFKNSKESLKMLQLLNNLRKKFFKKANIEPIVVYTHKPYIPELIKYFRKKR